ncbi:unnamed protein product [Eruca vesicaria subsp. sativa]|uniref:Uncharacterized protein n=1 Tax=Eruca vesicaria subsp. sativa TaxID=29727 RepID=A0ABC8KNY3_ERUVS|nr:unnamed protein product [Eruca vesicaria subsp. sativa]
MVPRLFACFRVKGSSTSTAGKRITGHNAAVVAANVPAGPALPVLVQLFSSQGCKTSLEAEMLVSRLGRGDFDGQIRREGGAGSPAMVLFFHVDYWDYLGWKDPYGSSQWTVRQKAYFEVLNQDTMFIPQFVVQVRVQFLGNEEDALLISIVEAPTFPSLAFRFL